jgi:hypothetical protein
MDHRKVFVKKMKKSADNIRMILKFDTGADGFQKMIYVLAISAILLVILGFYFLSFVYKDLSIT